MTTGDSDCRARGSDGSTATILRSGGVLRCRPDGSKLEVVASGLRNPWGNVAFDDQSRMFHTDNDNEGAPGFTGCRLIHVVEGGDYGWRLREGARCCQPDFDRATWNGGRPGRLGWIAETGRWPGGPLRAELPGLPAEHPQPSGLPRRLPQARPRLHPPAPGGHLRGRSRDRAAGLRRRIVPPDRRRDRARRCALCARLADRFRARAGSRATARPGGSIASPGRGPRPSPPAPRSRPRGSSRCGRPTTRP